MDSDAGLLSVVQHHDGNQAQKDQHDQKDAPYLGKRAKISKGANV